MNPLISLTCYVITDSHVTGVSYSGIASSSDRISYNKSVILYYHGIYSNKGMSEGVLNNQIRILF